MSLSVNSPALESARLSRLSPASKVPMASTYQATGISTAESARGSLPRQPARVTAGGQRRRGEIGAPALQHAPRVLPPSEMKTPIQACGPGAETRPRCPACARVCEGSRGRRRRRQKGVAGPSASAHSAPPTPTHTRMQRVF